MGLGPNAQNAQPQPDTQYLEMERDVPMEISWASFEREFYQLFRLLVNTNKPYSLKNNYMKKFTRRFESGMDVLVTSYLRLQQQNRELTDRVTGLESENVMLKTKVSQYQVETQ